MGNLALTLHTQNFKFRPFVGHVKNNVIIHTPTQLPHFDILKNTNTQMAALNKTEH